MSEHGHSVDIVRHSMPLLHLQRIGYTCLMGQGFSRRRFLVAATSGLAAAGLAAAAPVFESEPMASAGGTRGNPNLLWNGSFEVGTLSSAESTTSVWAAR